MLELEFYNTFIEVGAAVETYNDRFQALLFAFLIASYLVAAKLDRMVASIVIALYSIMMLRYGLVYFNATGDMVAMAAVLREYASQSGSSLSWLEIGPIQVNYSAVLIMYALSYLASILFFFYMRHRRPGSL